MTPKKTRKGGKEAKDQKVTRSGRKVKVPQHDGLEDCSESDAGSDVGSDFPIPQLDGNGDGQSHQYPNQMAPGVQMAYTMNQGNSGVIPILMPPGFGTNYQSFKNRCNSSFIIFKLYPRVL